MLRTSARKAKKTNAATGQNDPIATAGDVLADGAIVELVRDAATGQLRLLPRDGARAKVAPRAEHKGCGYTAPSIDPTLLRALRLPARTAPYGSTRELFTAVAGLFARYGLPEQSAKLLAYFTFATWFADCMLLAPMLVVVGPGTEATLLFRLLACLCRRALLLGDLTPAGLSSLLMDLHPTLLVNQANLSRAARKLMHASCVRNAYIPRGRHLLDPFCAKAVYLGEHSRNHSFGDSALYLMVIPTHRRLPLLDAQAEEQIADQFQSKLLSYRLANHSKVRNSDFQVAAFTSPIAALARTLGACIVDDRELQSGLETLLRRQDEAVRVRRVTGLEAVVIGALWVLCHEERESAYVGEIAKVANGILLGRGETLELEPRAVGSILDELGLCDRPRHGRGCRILLLDETRRRVHELAYAYGVASVGGSSVRCPHRAATGSTV